MNSRVNVVLANLKLVAGVMHDKKMSIKIKYHIDTKS